MKKSLLLAFVVSLFAVNAQAADLTPYVSAKAKFAAIRPEAKQTAPNPDSANLNDSVFGYNLAAGAGMKMEEGTLRLELEYAQNGDAEKTVLGQKFKFKSHAVFVNAYFDFNTNSAFRPYVGIGLGGSKVKFANNKNEDDFAYNYSLGVSYLINDNAALDLGYRFASYANYDEEITGPGVYRKIEYKAYANELMLGVRFSF